jgi:hypothetical protein
MAEAGKKSLLQFLEAVKALVRPACLFRVYVTAGASALNFALQASLRSCAKEGEHAIEH